MKKKLDVCWPRSNAGEGLTSGVSRFSLGALRKLECDTVTIESFENYSGDIVSILIKATKEKCWMLDSKRKMEQN